MKKKKKFSLVEAEKTWKMSVGELIKGKFWVEASGTIKKFSAKWRA